MRHILSNVEAILGPVDILVNASGLTLDKSLEDADVGEWEQAAISKAKAAFIFSKAVVPGMKERGQGHVISIVSPFGTERRAAQQNRPLAASPALWAGGQRLRRGGISARNQFLECGGGGPGSGAALQPGFVLLQRRAFRDGLVGNYFRRFSV